MDGLKLVVFDKDNTLSHSGPESGSVKKNRKHHNPDLVRRAARNLPSHKSHDETQACNKLQVKEPQLRTLTPPLAQSSRYLVQFRGCGCKACLWQSLVGLSRLPVSLLCTIVTSLIFHCEGPHV